MRRILFFLVIASVLAIHTISQAAPYVVSSYRVNGIIRNFEVVVATEEETPYLRVSLESYLTENGNDVLLAIRFAQIDLRSELDRLIKKGDTLAGIIAKPYNVDIVGTTVLTEDGYVMLDLSDLRAQGRIMPLAVKKSL